MSLKETKSPQEQQPKKLLMAVHLFGAMCAGKTTVINRVQEIVPDVRVWDIKNNFYIPKGIIKNNKFDWDLYSMRSHLIQSELKAFFECNREYPIILESSGLNRNINLAIKGYGFEPVQLETPKIDVLLARAKKRDGSTERVEQIRDAFVSHMKSIKQYINPPVTPEEAYLQISIKFTISKMAKELADIFM